MNEQQMKEKIKQGHILAKVIFQMAGTPKDYVENALKGYIKEIKKDPDYVFMNEEWAPCEKGDDEIWSIFLEADVLIGGFSKLNMLCFNLSPASIEILEPEEFKLTEKQVTDIYNDVTSKIHEVGITLKNFASENELLKVNLNKLIQNCIMLSLTEARTAEEIGLKIGIGQEHIQPFLEAMQKEKLIIKDGEKYTRNK